MQPVLRSLSSLALLIMLLAGLAALPVAPTHAQTPEEVKAQIEEKNAKIKALDEEIAQYQKQLNTLGGQHQTLQSAISALEVTRSKTQTELARTQTKISSSNLKLQELSYEIATKEDVIRLDKAALAKSLRELASGDDTTLIEHVLASASLTDAWAAADSMASVNAALQDHADELAGVTRELASQHEQVAVTKAGLTDLSNDLAAQKKQIEVAKSEKDKLLAATKSQESSYQNLIATKRAQQKAFESELKSLEESLKPVAAATVPHVGSGILAWPYSAAFAATCTGKASALGNAFCITQYFGNTAFATANAQIYNGGGHNAIDIGMPVGTPVLAALSGTVLGTGNTDAVPGCYSFGKWVVVKHANGLATLYAHLSSIGVSAGQSVATGQQVGLSGMTGYATGPHLHFGVYASSGIQIMTLAAYRGATTPCANATMPVSPVSGYLNPMSYL